MATFRDVPFVWATFKVIQKGALSATAPGVHVALSFLYVDDERTGMPLIITGFA